MLNERFSNGIKGGKEDNRPCILLIDELDLLVTRNQSVNLVFLGVKFTSSHSTDAQKIVLMICSFSLQVLYNILDWPTKPRSKLIVIGTNLFNFFF